MVKNVKKEVLNFLSILEGNHQLLKGLHWSTTNKSQHTLLDEIDGAVLEYEDKIAENAMGTLNTRFGVGDIKTLLPNAKTLDSLLKELEGDLFNLRNQLDDKKYCGIVNILDDFATDINKWNYLKTLS